MAKENVIEFFARYDDDEALRERVRLAEEYYPGSLELREPLVEAVLLPIAAELDLPFTVGELRAYETKLKLERQAKEAGGEFSYWLLDHGWSNDEAQFCGENEKE